MKLSRALDIAIACMIGAIGLGSIGYSMQIAMGVACLAISLSIFARVLMDHWHDLYPNPIDKK